MAWCHHSVSDKSKTTSIFRSLSKSADGMHLTAIVIHSKIIHADRAIWRSPLLILLTAHCGYSSNADCSLSGYWFSVHRLFLHLEVSSWPGGACIRLAGYDNGGGASGEVFIGWLLLSNKYSFSLLCSRLITLITVWGQKSRFPSHALCLLSETTITKIYLSMIFVYEGK